MTKITMTTSELLACNFYLTEFIETDTFEKTLSKVREGINTVCEVYEDLNLDDLAVEIQGFAETIDEAVTNAIAYENVFNSGGR